MIIEDPDAPSEHPLVHAIVWNLSASERRLAEGAINCDSQALDLGSNSCFNEGWLPPDPPTGHASHDYVFQLFALSNALQLEPHPGRSALVDALRGNVLAAGL